MLYNWAASTNKKGGPDGSHVFPDESEAGGATTELVGVKGICPLGWHLPSDLEWNRLETELSNNPEKYVTGYIPGTIGAWNPSYNTLVEKRGQHQKVMNSTTMLPSALHPGTSNPAAEGGFDVLSVGIFLDGNADDYGLSASFWTSSAVVLTSSAAWFRSIVNSQEYPVYRITSERRVLYSVRCKRDAE